MTIGFAIVPFSVMFMVYMLVSAVYAVLLTVKYLRSSDGLIGSSRRFMLFSDVFLGRVHTYVERAVYVVECD